MNEPRIPILPTLLCVLALFLSLYTLSTTAPQHNLAARKTLDLAQLQKLSGQLFQQETSRDQLRRGAAETAPVIKSLISEKLALVSYELKELGKSDAGDGYSWQSFEVSVPSIEYAEIATLLEKISAQSSPPRIKELSFAPGPDAGRGRLHVLIDVLMPPGR